jgi:hypothetical protein
MVVDVAPPRGSPRPEILPLEINGKGGPPWIASRMQEKTIAVSEQPNELERLWQSIPKLLDQHEGWALRDVLAAGVAGYTREDDTPDGLLIRHDPDGTRHLVRINLDGPDTVIGVL